MAGKQGAVLTEKHLEKMRKSAGTRNPLMPLHEFLGVSIETLAAWRQRGRAELVRMHAGGPMARVRPSEKPYVELARLAGIGQHEIVPIAPPVRHRPVKLTEAMADNLIAALSTGLSEESAAALAGLAVSSVRKWRARGLAVLDLINAADDGDEVEIAPEELCYLSFYLRCAQVRATQEQMVIEAYRFAMTGALDAEGVPVKDDRGRMVAPPDWRAAESYADRRMGETWRKSAPKDPDGQSAAAVAAREGARQGGGMVITVQHAQAPVMEEDEVEKVVDVVARPALPVLDGESLIEETGGAE